LVHFEATTDALEDLAAFTTTAYNFTGRETSARVAGAQVSEAYFRAFRAPLASGHRPDGAHRIARPDDVGRARRRSGGLGLAIGLFAAYLLATALSAVLCGARPHDLTAFVGVAVTFLVVCLLAVAVPAAKASRITGAA